MLFRSDRNTLTKIVGLYAIYTVLLVVTFGAVITLSFEIDTPGASIKSYGDAVWWGFVTVTTVGYGDFTPITVPGRITAVLIMFTGAASVGAVTAAVASRFITGASSSGSSSSSDSDDSQTPQASHPSPAVGVVLQEEETTLADLGQQIASLQAQMEAIAAKLDADSGAATRASAGE